jgi:hypothetical protein
MSEVAEKAGDIAGEVVEEAIDGVVDVVTVVKNNPTSLFVVGVVCLAAGGAGGYFIAKSTLRKFYEDLASEEIAQAKEFYAGFHKVDEDGGPITPQAILQERHGAEAAAEAVNRYRGTAAETPTRSEEDLIAEAAYEQGSPHDDEVDEAQMAKLEESARSVWDGPVFDYDEEVAKRTPTKPYLITHDEYFAAEKEYDTQSLTYYDADDTLADEKDQPIREIDQVIGEENLVRFGVASQDPNIVYVRNDRLETDYEISRSGGSYLEEVLGIEEDDTAGELRHSNRTAQQRRRREFRHGDG